MRKLYYKVTWRLHSDDSYHQQTGFATGDAALRWTELNLDTDSDVDRVEILSYFE